MDFYCNSRSFSVVDTQFVGGKYFITIKRSHENVMDKDVALFARLSSGRRIKMPILFPNGQNGKSKNDSSQLSEAKQTQEI
jgi:hypothetical protein